MSQKPLADASGFYNLFITFLGMTDMTTNIISKIESNDRHVIDAELLMISKALGVTMEWLVGESNEPYSKSSIFKNE